jgi:hypothetical protein
MFENYQERGKRFKEIVHALKGKDPSSRPREGKPS